MVSNRPLTSHDGLEPDRPQFLWEETDCLLCGRNEASLLAEAGDQRSTIASQFRFAVVRCRHCGLVYTNPRPTAESLAPFYPTHYAPHRLRQKRHLIRRSSGFLNRLFGRPCPERRGLLPWPSPGRLLDFGCGGGSYLCEMAARGWQVTGLDSSTQTVQSIREQYGFDAVAGTLPHPDLTPGSFDVITMWQSLEHVSHPLTVLRAAHELLVPGGKLIVAVPNYESLSAKWFGEYWFGLDLPRHLTHFAPRTLSEMLQTSGFRMTAMRNWVHADWLRTSAKQAIATGAGGLRTSLLARKTLSRLLAWYSHLRGRPDSIVAVAERPM
ncbi:MAG TPA: class I SAM-dependent methyltransferase [Gemmata sp.]|jgi:2-polyprenyl-3-methyl-5-hydroxy-6-metoxy-1,4-benzoquinol methylase|nr:class I SAM-dependent methyltransferase [Gemmata sp.]